MNKRLKKLFLVFLILFILSILFSIKTFARDITTDINGIDESQYPGIKSKIQALQNNHPNWTFKVEYTNLSWEEVINGEHQGHSISTSPSNLSPADSASYEGLWICEICGRQRYDTGSWYCASKEALEYMIDPRNSVNETDLFQFMQLSIFEDFDTEQVRNTLNSIKPGWVDDECINAIIDAGRTYHVDPYYILAKLLEEQSGSSPLFTGNGYNGLYQGYYNLFNIGATANTQEGVMLNGLAYAALPENNWTSRRESILGGVRIISANYISKEQDTLYYQKYDVIGDSKYEHQYQQNVLGAQTAGTLLKKSCSNEGNYSFIIPLYKNMPTSDCPRPSVSQEHSQNSGIMLGDVSGDGQISLIDTALMLNHIRGKITLTGNDLLAARVSGSENISLIDVALVLNVIRGKYSLPTSSYQNVTANTSTRLRLSPNGTEFNSVSNGMTLKVLQRAVEPVADVYWDLVVAANGSYGYINRQYYQ